MAGLICGVSGIVLTAGGMVLAFSLLGGPATG